MNKTRLVFYGVIVLTLAFGLAKATSAQTGDITAVDATEVQGDSVDVVSDDVVEEETTELWDEAVLEEEVLENIEVEEITEVPSGWGLFWRGIRERVSIVTTFDPVKKAEKRIKFAEERMKIAEVIAEKSQDPKIQAKAEKMIEKANKFMEKVEENKEKWMDHPLASERKLIKNIANHQIRRENIMDKLEEKLPEDKFETIVKLRENALEKTQNLFKVINNENIPEEVRAHLEKVKVRIEEHVQEVKEFQENKHELLLKVKAGDETATDALKELREERHEMVKERLEQHQEVKVQLREAAKEGDVQAQEKLHIINKTDKKIIEAHQEAVQARKAGIQEQNLGNKVEFNQPAPVPLAPKAPVLNKLQAIKNQLHLNKENSAAETNSGGAGELVE